ncbi:MAG: IS1595 family transposase [Gemmatimonadota bacterium]|nr:IS1595 family transposase [Gemmatimonadota bacterium]MDE2870915.1 IS1595 family transposase [Gemmatimonadota bacterium]
MGITDAATMFATEEKAIAWFEERYWGGGREPVCLRCGSLRAYRVKSGKPQPYHCRDCRRYFSLKTGTVMERSQLPLRLWAWAIYLEMSHPKGISAMQLHKDLDISYPSAWFMLHRIREGMDSGGGNPRSGTGPSRWTRPGWEGRSGTSTPTRSSGGRATGRRRR